MKFYIVSTTDDCGYSDAIYCLQSKIDYKCEKCDSIYGEERKENYRVKFMGRKLADFYNAPGCFIGNQKFRNMLEKYRITGFEIREINCIGWYDRRNNPIDVSVEDLKEIYILGRCGYMCHLDGTEVDKCDVCGCVSFEAKESVKGLQVPLETWDGSDIFSFSNWDGVMICTEKLKIACEKEKIKNITFEPIEEFCFFPWIKI